MGKKFLSIIWIVILCMISTSAYAEWHFGIGTGPARLSIDGDMGLNIPIAGGPVKFKVKADPDDIADVVDSAFGLGGYAANGRWLFQASYGKMDLEDKIDIGESRLELGFDITSAEFMTSYTIFHNDVFDLNLIGGLRYTEHELSSDFRFREAETHHKRKLDNDWTDVVIGTSAVVPFTQTLSWKTSFDYGFGGSEGTFTANTGLTWRFFRGFSATLFYKYAAVDFEDGSRGDADWYLYDIDETSLGLTILYNW